MKQKITLILFGVIALGVLCMGLMENALSSIGGTPAIIAAYVVIGIILVILYIKASKAAKAEKENELQKKEDPEE